VSRRLITYPELQPKKGVPYTETHLARLEKAGRWPRRIKLSHRCIAWDEDEIDAHIEKLAAARDVPPAA
jgi:prophage regulatory protein